VLNNECPDPNGALALSGNLAGGLIAVLTSFARSGGDERQVNNMRQFARWRPN
jgi:hypothetical protein